MGLKDIAAVEEALKASLATSFDEPETKLAKAFEVIVNVVREQNAAISQLQIEVAEQRAQMGRVGKLEAEMMEVKDSIKIME